MKRYFVLRGLMKHAENFERRKKNENKKPVRLSFYEYSTIFFNFFLTLGRKLNVFCVTKLPELRMMAVDWRQVGR